MSDDGATADRQEGKSDDSGYTASPPSPPPPHLIVTDFEIQECKPEPCSIVDNPDEELSEFDNPSTLHVSAFTIRSPIILLERCDKIWETLQLIRTVQDKSPMAASDHKNEEKKEEATDLNIKTEQPTSYTRSQRILRNDNTKRLFQFSVQRTRKLYPCVTCGKQYLERRSLRKHSERVHGVVLPLLKPKRRSNKKSTFDQNYFNKDDSTDLLNKGGSNSEKLCDRKDSHEKATKYENTKFPIRNSLKRNINSTNNDSQFNEAESKILPARTKLTTCTLCRQKVLSIRKHLICYHKIGSNTSMMQQLESSLLLENGESSGHNKDVLPDKSQISDNEDMQDKLHMEDKAQEISQVRKKRKRTLTYVNAKKRFKLDIGHYTPVQNAFVQKYISLKDKSYKCDICLGLYSSANSFAKHKRIHRLRGETKENFHNFKCRYFNSPLNKKYQLSESSVQSTNTTVKNTSNRIKRGNNIPRISRIAMYSGKMNKKNDTTCICGRIFRNPYTLFVHKNKCKLSKQEDEIIQHTLRDKYSSDRDSGIGINITIKKRNNSYEIVGKDEDEDKLKSEHLIDATSSSSISDLTIKDSANVQELDTSESSKYSKDHSILKLQAVDEDMIIDIEDDVQLISDKNDKIKQEIIQNTEHNYSQKMPDDNVENTKNNEVRTLKQMCQKVLEKTMMDKSKDTVVQQENKMNLRSSNKSYQSIKKELIEEDSRTENCSTKFDPLLTCGYCNKQFNTVSLCNKHQCTVKHGKQFDRFSLNLLCFCCNDVLNDCNKFDEHMRVKHFDRAYYCYLCPNRFTSDRERKRHSREEHDTSCRFCKKKFAISIKAFHEAYHLGFGHPCHKCKKAYTTSKSLSYHKSTIHMDGADNVVICNICLKPVKLKTFRRHMYAHNHNRNECHFCGKVLANRTCMEYHTLMYHQGTNSKIRCNACGARFYNKRQLENHEKENKCNYRRK